MEDRNLENMEDVLRKTGGLGKFQFMVLSSMLFLEIPVAFVALGPIVISVPPKEWLCDNVTVPASEACSCSGTLSGIYPEHSIVAEWQLVCDYAWVPDAILSLQLASTLFGNMVVSVLSDWYGRRYCYFASSLLMMLGTVLTAVASGPYMYAASRVCCGLSLSGFMTMSVVYIMEFLSPEHRLLASSLGTIGEGTMLLALVSYYVKPWRLLTWLSLMPHAMAIVVFIIVPESPRWLLRVQKFDRCHQVVTKIARMNGRSTVSLKTLEEISKKELAAATGGINVSDDKQSNTKAKRFTFLDFYRQSSLRRLTITMQIMWFSWGAVYFGITFSVQHLGLNMYLSLALMGLADAFGYPMALCLPKRHGRRSVMIFFLGASAVFLGAIAVLRSIDSFTGSEIVVGACGFLGKFCLSAARTPFRTLTGESYPTAVRTMGTALARSLASVGAALAPQLIFLGSVIPSLPYFVLAGIGVVNCMCAVSLTETSGKAMSEEVKVNAKTKK